MVTRTSPLVLILALWMVTLDARGLQRPVEPADPMNTVIHPAALAKMIDEIGGRRVLVTKAKVIAILNPRAFLIESAAALAPFAGSLDRVLVLIDDGMLRVEAADLIDSNVRVFGIARTLLGLQTTAEVPWPPELTREALKRYEIRAAVLARSVQTSDGVELTRH
jgi:hypothetical protein